MTRRRGAKKRHLLGLDPMSRSQAKKRVWNPEETEDACLFDPGFSNVATALFCPFDLYELPHWCVPARRSRHSLLAGLGPCRNGLIHCLILCRSLTLVFTYLPTALGKTCSLTLKAEYTQFLSPKTTKYLVMRKVDDLLQKWKTS